MSFNIEHNYEFYCFLKANLPKEYRILAEPSPTYYSEWCFDYRILHNDKVIEEIKGNFNNYKRGELVNKAKDILKYLKP